MNTSEEDKPRECKVCAWILMAILVVFILNLVVNVYQAALYTKLAELKLEKLKLENKQ